MIRQAVFMSGQGDRDSVIAGAGGQLALGPGRCHKDQGRTGSVTLECHLKKFERGIDRGHRRTTPVHPLETTQEDVHATAHLARALRAVARFHLPAGDG